MHTEYSLLDGASRIKDLINRAKALDMKALAITDHGNMYGVINFYKAAQKAGIKPIVGCEVYLAPHSRKIHNENDRYKYYHLILLVKNSIGYQNLIKLVSAANIDGFYYKPRIDKQLLRKYSDGLIALSACIAGEIPRAILQNNFEQADKLVLEYIDIFGKENFYLEIQNHGLEEEKKVNAALVELSKKYDVGLVATNDSHYTNSDDSDFHDILLCIQTGTTKNDEKRFKFSSNEYYLKSAEEMSELFSQYPEALDNTIKIAERCNLSIEFDKLKLPNYPIPSKFGKKKINNDAEYLRALCEYKVTDKYSLITQEITDRLNYELEIIHNMKYDSYFLIVYDFINYAKNAGIPVGPGRGSAAGSIVAYILGITDIDPLQFDLLFERFLNPERVTMPDIDVDFCFVRREEVIEYVKKRYGKNNVAQIITFGTMAAKAAIRDVGRVLNMPYAEVSRIVKMIPNELKITIDKALETSNQFRYEYENNAEVKKLIDYSRKLEGLPRHSSTHAAGVVITPKSLKYFVPLQITGGTLITQYDKDIIEELGLLKMDFLGLRTLTTIKSAIDNIKISTGKSIDINKIPLDDPVTSKMLADGQTGAVFQMESAGMTNMVKELQPENFFDLIPTVALYRPGPLGSGMVEDFIARKHGKKSITYLHPLLEPILKETYGVILYQEQVMQIVQALAGFTLGQADLLRRAMGKKKAEILLSQKNNFINGCLKNGIDEALANKIFELLAHFADYGFNKSHSVAYALLSWRTAYLKAHYPIEFMAAMMSSVMNSDKITDYIELARRMNIKIITPDINTSIASFYVKDNNIVFGLAAIKNIGEAMINSVVEIRERDGNFKSLLDFCLRVNHDILNKRAIESLIKCGAFDSIDNRRTALLAALDDAIAEGVQKKLDDESGQVGLFRNENDSINFTNFKIPDIPEKSKRNILSWEYETLGFYLSGHPLDEYADKIKHLTTVKDIVNKIVNDGKIVKLAGLIIDINQRMVKSGDTMCFMTLEDFTGRINVTVFPDVLRKNQKLLYAGSVVILQGRAENSEDEAVVIASNISDIEHYTPSYYLNITSEFDNPIVYNKLKTVFKSYQGQQSVFTNKNGQWQKMSSDYCVKYDNFVTAAFESILGKGNLHVY